MSCLFVLLVDKLSWRHANKTTKMRRDMGLVNTPNLERTVCHRVAWLPERVCMGDTKVEQVRVEDKPVAVRNMRSTCTALNGIRWAR